MGPLHGIYYLLEEEKAPRACRKLVLVEQAVRASRKWVFTVWLGGAGWSREEPQSPQLSKD